MLLPFKSDSEQNRRFVTDASYRIWRAAFDFPSAPSCDATNNLVEFKRCPLGCRAASLKKGVGETIGQREGELRRRPRLRLDAELAES
jgi:hypothetical protein